MKKLFSMILLAVVLFAACTHENNPVVKQIVTIQASIASDSRVALGDGENEKKVSWTTGDVINLTIGEDKYSFIWQQENTFAYTDSEKPLPALTEDMQISAAYASTFKTKQTGLKADVGRYMALSATETVQTGQDYSDLNLTFSHGTSVLRLTLSNDAFKNSSVTDITVKAGTTVVASTTATFTGDSENGRVTAYLAIQPATLENVTIHATCNGNTYTNSLAKNTIGAGKLYEVNKTLPYAYVDLGLSVKWASFNVGATSAEEAGGYFAWGETVTKEKYGYADYKYLKTSYLKSFTKYCNSEDYGYDGYTDNLTTLESIDDAATANWGNNWRMPTSAEMQELLTNCTLTWTTLNEVSGCMITSTVEGYTDKSIFIPAAGYKDHTGTLYSKNEYGYYWSNSLNADYLERGDPSNADYLPIFQPGSEWWQQIMIFPSVRTDGSSVRPVYVGN